MNDEIPRNEKVVIKDAVAYIYVTPEKMWGVHRVDLDDILIYSREGPFASIPNYLVSKSLRADDDLLEEYSTRDQLISVITSKL